MDNELAILSNQIAELRQIVSTPKLSRLDDSLFSKELAPHYGTIAEKLSKSSLVPKALMGKPNDVFIVMEMGYQLGMSIAQSIQDIACINGRPCVWGDAMLALCMKNPDFIDIIEEPIVQGSTVTGYKCTVKRRNMSDHTKYFTLDMAKKAGLLGKQGPWITATDRMLQMRARSFALRDRFPGELKGIKSREEVEDYMDAEYVVDDTQKATRTEFLKQDVLRKQGLEHEPIQINAQADSSVSSSRNPQEAAQDYDSYQVGAVGEQEVALDGRPVVPKVSEEQLRIINELIVEKHFAEERFDKALVYYDVEFVYDLPSDLADHFIAMLRKEP
jgi:hypothetical protein